MNLTIKHETLGREPFVVYETREEAVAALDYWATDGDESLVYCYECAKKLNCGVYHEVDDHLTQEEQ